MCILSPACHAGTVMYVVYCLLLVIVALGQPLLRQNVTLLDQDVGITGGRILCQQLTGLQGTPLLLAADDVTLPVAAQCDMLYLSFAVLRQWRDADPSSVTVQVLRHVYSTNLPGRVVYQRSWAWSTVGSSVTGQLTRLELTLAQGGMDDDGITRLALTPGATLWIALYVTMAPHQSATGQNAFYWATAASSGTSGHAFAYRDTTNLQHWNLSNWSPASVAGPLLALTDRQMAWRASLHCPVATPAPSVSPTLAPSGVPTGAPTAVNESAQNLTDIGNGGGGGGTSALTPSLVVSIALACLVTLALLSLVWWRRRQRLQREAVQRVDIREKLVRPHTVDFDQFVGRNPFMRDGDEPVRVFTSGREMVNISLSEGSNGAYARILDDSIVDSSDGEQQQ